MVSIDDEFNKTQYNQNVQRYLNSNVDEHIGGGVASNRVEFLRKYLPGGSSIFEIGSGGGADALALQQAGYKVTPSDVSEEFVKVLESKRLSAVLFDAKHDEIPKGYDAFYANAVFVHFTPEQLAKFLRKTKEQTGTCKILYCSVIKGEGGERRGGKQGFDRDFQYYSEESLAELFSHSGYAILEIRLVDNRWIQLVAKT